MVQLKSITNNTTNIIVRVMSRETESARGVQTESAKAVQTESAKAVQTESARGVLIIDTETTGFPSKRNRCPSDFHYWDTCRLVQIAWQIHDKTTRDLVSRQEFIIQPDGFTITNAFIHGITTEIATEKGVAIQTMFDALATDLATVDVLVAHNFDFDDGVVLAELYRFNQIDIIQQWISKTQRCTMKMGALPNAKWPKLAELYQQLFQEAPKITLHRAANDVDICAQCYFELLRLIQQ